MTAEELKDKIEALCVEQKIFWVDRIYADDEDRPRSVSNNIDFMNALLALRTTELLEEIKKEIESLPTYSFTSKEGRKITTNTYLQGEVLSIINNHIGK